MNVQIENRKVYKDISVFQALKAMDIKKSKVLFVFDDNDEFISILTIGDIQRAIINDNSLSTPISRILDKKKIFATSNEDIEEIRNKMLKLRAECMPVLDSNGKLIDAFFWKDLFLDKIERNDQKINLPVVIMAGGKGTRLKPLTNVIPKPLIPISDKTILEEIMDQFESIGCNDFYMSINYKSDMIRFYLTQLDHKYNIEFFEEIKPLGTVGSVSLLKNRIKKPFFVSNCDIIIDQDYRDVYEYHSNNKNDITIVAAVKSLCIPYGVIKTAEGGLMLSMREKPEESYMINTGVYLLQPELIAEIPENEFYHITDLIDNVRKRGGRIGCFPVSEKSWTDIGDWNEYLKLIKR